MINKILELKVKGNSSYIKFKKDFQLLEDIALNNNTHGISYLNKDEKLSIAVDVLTKMIKKYKIEDPKQLINGDNVAIYKTSFKNKILDTLKLRKSNIKEVSISDRELENIAVYDEYFKDENKAPSMNELIIREYMNILTKDQQKLTDKILKGHKVDSTTNHQEYKMLNRICDRLERIDNKMERRVIERNIKNRLFEKFINAGRDKFVELLQENQADDLVINVIWDNNGLTTKELREISGSIKGITILSNKTIDRLKELFKKQIRK